MPIYNRCPACGRFNVIKNSSCSKCGVNLKTVKNYYSRITVDGKRKWTRAADTITDSKRAEAKLIISSEREHENRLILPFDEYVSKYFISHYDAKNKAAFQEIPKFKKIVEFFRGKLLSEITPMDVDRYYQYKLKTCKPATAKNHLAIIRRMFNYAIEMGFLKENPVKTKPVSFDNARIRHLSDDEKVRLLASCKESKNKNLYNIVLIAMKTGMRKGEIQTLTPADIKNNTIYLKAENTKTSKGRIIPLNKELIEIFGRLGSFDFSLNFREAFERAVAKAEIQDFRFHDLRHTFASDLVIKGVDLYTVSKLLGHSTIEMTQRYAHLAPDALKRAMDKLD